MPNQVVSTILTMQDTLFKLTDPNIITKISQDGTTIIASNISEESFKNITLITNNPSHTNSYMYLLHINVYLDNSLYPTEIYGLTDIVKKRVELSCTQSFISGQRTNQPFFNGFKEGRTISELIDILSSLSTATPYTYGKVKNFDLLFDPECDCKKTDHK